VSASVLALLLMVQVNAPSSQSPTPGSPSGTAVAPPVSQTTPSLSPAAPSTASKSAIPTPSTASPLVPSHFVSFYAEHLRGNLFNGFLTLAAFLLSAETFIIVHLQKEVYGKPAYQKQIQELKQVKSNLSAYGPLRRLNMAMFAAVVMSLLTALLQLTIGVIQSDWAAWLCIGSAGLALVPLGICVWAMGSAMRSWFVELEREASNQANTESQSG
jgi:hypothetical protein